MSEGVTISFRRINIGSSALLYDTIGTYVYCVGSKTVYTALPQLFIESFLPLFRYTPNPTKQKNKPELSNRITTYLTDA